MLLSGFTRENVTVALSGDGGDEAFAGYRRYVLSTAADRMGIARRLPGCWRESFAADLDASVTPRSHARSMPRRGLAGRPVRQAHVSFRPQRSSVVFALPSSSLSRVAWTLGQRI